jgi:hypothetical protein
MIKDGRSQRWSLADNLWANAANGKKAAHPATMGNGRDFVKGAEVSRAHRGGALHRSWVSPNFREGRGLPLKPPRIPSTHWVMIAGVGQTKN